MTAQFDFILIDDSAFDLFIYEKLIIKSGIGNSVRPFNSAQDALEYLTGVGENLPKTVILLDLQMPGMNGFEFIDQFDLLPEQIKDKIRIYMLSSTIDTRDIDKAKASTSIIDLLSKPLEISLLKTILTS
ncbi:two-component system response regulator [Dyadobacter subterraneus]|uniref:Response regulator n=1 Tax=Dyadobacter subterraneus TaxID=2773304 RepID=A0ABR9WA49_9BACT|nr:response regulator [Dyadobacter subterraneus]MBE9461256.1 response regulator [Dyadobacter subterraneus]